MWSRYLNSQVSSQQELHVQCLLCPGKPSFRSCKQGYPCKERLLLRLIYTIWHLNLYAYMFTLILLILHDVAAFASLSHLSMKRLLITPNMLLTTCRQGQSCIGSKTQV